jgi:hypothetical protein
MFKMSRAAIAVVAVLALTGCSAAAADEISQPRIAAESSSSTPEPTETATPTPTAAPIEITPTAAPGRPEFNGFSSQREWFLRSLDGALSGMASSDDALISAGMMACDQLRSGSHYDDIRVVSGSGEDADMDNQNIVWAGVSVYCPELY